MNNYRGGITVFLSIVYLSIIVFSCSVVEMTRVNIAKVQAERALVSASQSVLGGYDLWLKDQYGIFARYEGYSDISFVDPDELQAYGLAHLVQSSPSKVSDVSLSNTNYSGTELDLAYYINSHLVNDPKVSYKGYSRSASGQEGSEDQEIGGFWHFYQTRLDDISLKDKLPLYNNTGDISYVKDEMLRFMDLRVPVLLLQPFLEKIEAFEKVSKTGSFLQEKNEIISRAALIEEAYLELYHLVEGIDINGTTGEFTSTGAVFVKGLAAGVDNYPPDYMADMDVKGLVEGQVVRLDVVMASYRACIEAYEDYHGRLVDIQVSIDALENGLASYQTSMAEYQNEVNHKNKVIQEFWADLRTLEELEEPTEADQERINELKTNIAADRDRISNISLQLDSLKEKVAAKSETLDKMKQEYNDVGMALEGSIDEGHQYLEVLGGSLLEESGFLAVNNKAANVIEGIRSEMLSMEGTIDDFVANSEQISDELIENTYTQSIEDVKSLKQSYGLNEVFDSDTVGSLDEEVDTDTVGDLNHMLDVLANNIGVLERVQRNNSYDELDDVHTSLSESATNIIEAYPSKLHAEYLMVLDTIVTEVESYRRDLYFDYSGFIGYSEEGQQEAAGIMEKFKVMKDSMDLTKVFEDAVPVHVPFLADHPSSVLGGQEMNAAGVDGVNDKDNANGKDRANGINSVGNIDSSNAFDGLSGLGGLRTLIGGVREQLFLNEYAIGMFCAYPDRNDESQLTLSGFAKNDHVLDTEVEYILTGRKDASDALRQTILMIIGVRVACNMIHLLTDGAKRTAIMNLANAIAGWWTLGAGALILGILITLLWASAESMVDVLMLTNGRRVPLIKNAGSWYTSLDGNVKDVVGLGADLAEAAAIKIIDVASGEVSRMIGGAGDILTEETERFYKEEMVLLYEEGLLHEEKEALDHEIVALAGEINNEIENYAEAGREGVRKIINEKKEAFLKDIRQRQLPADGISLKELLPMLSYHDYLRVFMLLNHQASDQRVYRMLDLIELNMYYAHGGLSQDSSKINPDNKGGRRLSDYFVSMEAVGTFQMEFGLFLENFHRYGRHNGEDVRSFSVSVVNGYE